MFELSIACKYLLPRWRQLSVSVISLISIGVISLVVWLIVVFFSVTNGLETFWIDKLINLTGPVRITPTEEYYQSYYYQIDALSDASNYQTFSISEKLRRAQTDPYDPLYDAELPSHLPTPDAAANGELKDLVKEVFTAIDEIPKTSASPYETTFGNIRLRLVRRANGKHGLDEVGQSFVAQAAMFGSLEERNPRLRDSLLPVRPEDITNLVTMAGTTASGLQSDSADALQAFDEETTRQRLRQVLQYTDLSGLQTAPEGWMIPRHMWTEPGWVEAAAVLVNGRPTKLILARTLKETQSLIKQQQQAGTPLVSVQARLGQDPIVIKTEDNVEQPLPFPIPIFLAPAQRLPASLVDESVEKASGIDDLRFLVETDIQGIPLRGEVGLRHLQIANFTLTDTFSAPPEQSPLWIHHLQGDAPRAVLPSDPAVGDGVLLPKQFLDVGILVGDRGYVSYYTPSPTSVQEQRLPVYVAGFYDPGMIPIGSKLVFTDAHITSLIRSAHGSDPEQGAGIRVRFDDYQRAEEVKAQLQKSLQDRGIAQYWKVDTFREYEYAGDILRQQQSDKNLFMVIAVVIIIVACSNIISMLIILVNDKKLEIGILRSMGASSRSIATIFGSCGFVMGLAGSLLGCLAALLTLQNLDSLISFISYLQGHQMFNPTFYGETLPSELSFEAIVFVLGLTAIFSLLAGIVPALKASWIQPSAILRSE